MGLLKPISNFPNTTTPRLTRVASTKYFTVRMSSSTTTAANSSSKSTKKAGKQGIKETLLTPRFYTTDFDEMETLFNTEINKNLNQNEFEALLQEFKTDYNQTHFVRNKEFKEAADKIQGPLRNIFVEFLERSCTAEFSGFLLYKELGRRLKVYSNLKMDFKFIFFPLNSKFLPVGFSISPNANSIINAENQSCGGRDFLPYVKRRSSPCRVLFCVSVSVSSLSLSLSLKR